MADATLITMKGAKKVTRAELKLVPTPQSLGRFHKPIPHFELVEALTDTLKEHKLTITREQFAVQDSSKSGTACPGALLFATFCVASSNGLSSYTRPGQSFALGLRSGNNKKMPLELAAGVNVLVCDNLAFNAALIALSKRHTLRLDLKSALGEGVERYLHQQVKTIELIDRAATTRLTSTTAKEIIYDTFVEHETLPLRFMPEVGRNYFEPTPEMTDCRGQTLWSLHNAFTRIMAPVEENGVTVERIPPRVKFAATAALGRLLEVNPN